MENFDLIQKYHNNQLSEIETSLFNEKFQTDLEFQKEVEAQKKMMDGFRSLRAESFENQLKEWSKEEEKDAKITPIGNPSLSRKSNKLRNLILGSAAILLLLFFARKLVSTTNNFDETISKFCVTQEKTTTANIDLLKENISSSERGGSNLPSGKMSEKTIQLLSSNISDYQSSNFQQCFYKSNDDLESPTLFQYLGAYCLFKHGEFAQAGTAFATLLSSKNLDENLDKNEIGWMAIFSQLKNYQGDLTVEKKGELKQMINHFLKNANPDFKKYIKKAKELQNLLN